MDRSYQTSSARDELRQIGVELKRARTVDDVRFYFDRVQNLRRTYADDFDLQLAIAEMHDQVIERGRQLREEGLETESDTRPAIKGEADPVRTDASDDSADTDGEGGVQKLDAKTWQRATYLALFFALLLFFAFFYLVQTARRLNFPQNAEVSTQPSAAAGKADTAAPGEKGAAQSAPAPPTPTLRIYTDLIPATLSIDDKEPQELKDGEFTLDKLEPGRHSVKVVGKSGSAAVSFDVSGSAAPRVIGQPVASNVMAVAVTTEDGKGSLITNAERPAVLLDGVSTGDADTGGVTLSDLGKGDHDLQVTENKDRQRFVLTYTPAPTLTLYIKADPNAGTVVVSAGQDEADVFINDKLYRRRTDRGQVRVPLKVGEYTIRVHKAGFIDPPPQTVQVKKAEESPLEFKLEPVPQIATLQVKGAPPGTMVYVDKDVAAVIGPDGAANISNVRPGDHVIELRRDQALPKKFERTFKTGDVVVLSGPDTALEKVVVDSKQPPPPPAADTQPAGAAAQANAMQIDGQQVRKGGGFVVYNVPKAPGHYSFQAQSRKGGLFKRGKVQWYAGYQDPENYFLYSLDGKRASLKEVRDGKSTELGRVPFEFENEDWVQVDMSVKPAGIVARVKTPAGAWEDLPSVAAAPRDLTQGKVGMYIPGSDELAVANFKFSNR